MSILLTLLIEDEGTSLNPNIFRSVWKTDNAGISAANQIQFPTVSSGTYNAEVSWGDGVVETITTWDDPRWTHTYPAPGEYTVDITGTFTGIRFFGGGDRLKILDISQCGVLNVGNLDSYFDGCSNLQWTASDPLDLTGTTNFTMFFQDCTSFNGNINNWNVSAVTSMDNLFSNCISFNKDLNSWNISSCTRLLRTFMGCISFNGNVSSWDTSIVTLFASCFENCTNFNMDITGWDVSLGVNFNNMLKNCVNFDQDISNWTPINATFMSDFLLNGQLSTEYYDLILQKWSFLSLQNNVNIDFGNSMYHSIVQPAKDNIISTYSWTITDGGVVSAFISNWNSKNTGVSADNQIKVPTISTGTYNSKVYWIDEEITVENITTWDDPRWTHTFSSEGTKTVIIEGTFSGFQFNNGGDSQKILNVSEWGPFELGNQTGYFYGCSNLVLDSVIDTLDLTGRSSLFQMFRNCTSLTTINNFELWDFTSVNNTGSMFQGCANYNDVNIESILNFSPSTSIAAMFAFCTSLNRNLNNIDYSNVFDTPAFLIGCTVFNNGGFAPNWNTANANSFLNFLSGCSSFNQSVNALDFSNASNMNGIFNNCTNFNNGGFAINWDWSSATLAINAFASCSNFNQNIVTLITSSMQNMGSFLINASLWNQDISNGDFSSITSLSQAFFNTSFDTINYDALLISLDSQTLQQSVSMSVGTTQYSSGAPATARANIISLDNWTITDGGELAAIFTSYWKTDNPGVSANNEIKLPLESTGTYNFTVNWGDGNQDVITVWNQAETTHTYAIAGEYTVEITGTIIGWKFVSTSDRQKILNISSWGELNVGNSNSYFRACRNLTITATDILDTTGTTDFSGFFFECDVLTTVPSINSWDTSSVTDMSSMFLLAFLFNQNLSFNTASVTDMRFMFAGASSFNSTLNFNTSLVTGFNDMFTLAEQFNKPINFDVGSASVMTNFLTDASNFNSTVTLSNSNTITSFAGFFGNCTSFNQPISFNTSSAQSFDSMFLNCTSLDQDFSALDVTSLLSATSMFSGVTLSTSNYNSLLIGWNAQTLQQNVNFDGGNSMYSPGTPADARTTMVNVDEWTITDGGQSSAFISNWQTNNSGVSASNQIKLPLEISGTYNFTVDWGDGSQDTITSWNQAETTHTYSIAGNYDVFITGTIIGWKFLGSTDKLKILNISEWGVLNLGNSGEYFFGCSNLTVTATDILDLTGTTNFNGFFNSCSSLTTVPSINSWSTGSVTQASFMFSQCSLFDQALSFDTTSVTTMASMFADASDFNSTVNFNTTSLTTTNNMFSGAISFDSLITFSDTSSLLTTVQMFSGAILFNQVLTMDTSNVNDMSGMFNGASSFNQAVNFNTGSVQLMSFMFAGAMDFNQPVVFDTSSCIGMDNMFNAATSFNQPLAFNTSSVTDMASMFNVAVSFDQDVSAFDVSNLLFAANMFNGVTLSTSNYNALLTGWDAQTLQPSVTFNGGNSNYSSGAPETARSNMISSDLWTITDGGLVNEFISTWKTDNPGVSSNVQIQLPLESSGTYNFTVFWGDGNQDTITAWNDPAVTHTYSISGNYEVKISGTINGWRFNNTGDKEKILNISSWGPLKLGNSGAYFYDCSNLTITATDILDLTGTTSLATMFRLCESLTDIPNITSWDFSGVTNMNGTFRNCSNLNISFAGIDTSSVTMLATCFSFAISLDQDFSSWDVSSVSNASGMFNGVTLSTVNYDALLIGWNSQTLQQNVSFSGGNSVYSPGPASDARTTMVNVDEWTITDGGQAPAFVSTWNTLFPGVSNNDQITLPLESSGTYNFTVFWGDGMQDTITAWNDPAVTHTYSVSASYNVTIIGTITGWVFNNGGDKDKLLNISEWGSLNLGNSGTYFYGCQNLTITATDNLDLTGTTFLGGAFRDCPSITTIPSINSWDTSNVINIVTLFRDSTSFNQALSFDTSSVTAMTSCFFNASSFNQPVNWDTSSTDDMRFMFFNATSFNQPLSFDTSLVTQMDNMFDGAVNFNQDIGAFNVTQLTSAVSMFNGATLSTDNYDSLLNGWESQLVQNNVTFDGGDSKYSLSGSTSRAALIADHSWIITDGGESDFISEWQTNNSGTSANNQILLPLLSSGTYNFNVDWGDGNNDNITVWNDPATTHTYSLAGTYTVKITGSIDGWRFNNTGDRQKILEISRFGPLRLGNSGDYFEGCSNLIITATDKLDLTGTTTLARAFRNCTSLTTAPSMSLWDTSLVTLMTNTFDNCVNFDQSLDNWDLTSCSSISSIFTGCSSFNQSLNNWNVSNINTANLAFFNCTSFNGNVSSWTLSSATALNNMFTNCIALNQDLSSWNVSVCSNFSSMFSGCILFNSNLSSWNVSSAITLNAMFSGATAFNQNIGSWDVSSVTSASSMFLGVTLSTINYDSLLNGWDAQALQSSVVFSGGNSQYSIAASAARANMISSDNWTITDGGQVP